MKNKKASFLGKAIWVDLLCPSSIIKIVYLSWKRPLEKIYYINCVKYCSRSVKILQRLIQKPIIQVDWIAEGQEKIGGVSLYELIQLRINDISDRWVKEERVVQAIDDFADMTNYNPVKFREHLKIMAYPHLLNIVKLQVFSEYLSGIDNVFYLIRSSPATGIFKAFLGIERTFFYATIISHRLKIPNRADYFYDSFVNKIHYSDRVDYIMDTFQSWLRALLTAILYSLWQKILQARVDKTGENTNIGVELIRSRVRLDEINDLYWLKDSGIDPNTVCGIEFEDYDQASSRTLSALGIKRYRIHWGPLRFIKLILSIHFKDDPRKPAVPDIHYCLKTFFIILRSFTLLFLWNEERWMQYQQIYYIWKVMFWEAVYRQLGVRLLWSMYDSADLDRVAKAQALEMLDGLYTGSHWSNYSLTSVESQKYSDVIFAWGPHFIRNIFAGYPYMEAFSAGYPLDYYFKEKESAAQKLRNKYPGRFILSYQDNAMSNDMMYSKKMQLDMHRMLIDLIEENYNLTVFLKPKRKSNLDTVLKELPDLDRYIAQGRIEVFLGDTPRTKVPPAAIGMASDLVVGLGISTAASECYFAGTVSFHADFTNLVGNEFVRKGLNAVVFHDIKSLREAILKRISGEETLTHVHYRRFYDMLDPFQDGEAYLRTGYIINRLQKAFKEGLSREGAVKRARIEYDDFLSRKGYAEKHSLPIQDAVIGV